MTENGNYPDNAWTREVCKTGQGAACCRYLTISPDGWSCEKHSVFAATLDARAAAGQMRARSDNCPGKDSR